MEEAVKAHPKIKTVEWRQKRKTFPYQLLLVPAGWSSDPQALVSWPSVNTAWSGLCPCALWRVTASYTCWRRPAVWRSDCRSPQFWASAGRSAVLNSAPAQRRHRTPDTGNPAGDQTSSFSNWQSYNIKQCYIFVLMKKYSLCITCQSMKNNPLRDILPTFSVLFFFFFI